MQNIVSHTYPAKQALGGLLVLLLMLSWSLPVHAAQPENPKGHLTGFIYKADGETPLKDARVVLEEFEKGKKTGKTFESNITDETGEYKLQDIPVGFYKGKVFLKKKHYKIKRVDFFVHIIAGETNFLSIALKKTRR
ncbi:MAG: hypothetical protein PVH61_04695 [Candidatus Aminicenantes bacterium]|jgi:hypothetical protein